MRRSRCLCTASVGGEGREIEGEEEGGGRKKRAGPDGGRGAARLPEGDFRRDGVALGRGVVLGRRVSLGRMRAELWAWSQ